MVLSTVVAVEATAVEAEASKIKVTEQLPIKKEMEKRNGKET